MRTHVQGAFRSGNEHACFVRAPRVLLHAFIIPGSTGRPARRPGDYIQFDLDVFSFLPSSAAPSVLRKIVT